MDPTAVGKRARPKVGEVLSLILAAVAAIAATAVVPEVRCSVLGRDCPALDLAVPTARYKQAVERALTVSRALADNRLSANTLELFGRLAADARLRADELASRGGKVGCEAEYLSLLVSYNTAVSEAALQPGSSEQGLRAFIPAMNALSLKSTTDNLSCSDFDYAGPSRYSWQSALLAVRPD